MISLNNYIKLAKKERHSDEYITDIEKYIQVLRANNLPIIFSLKHFATLLDINYLNVKDLIRNRGKNYKSYRLRKKRGGYRWIMSPSKQLKTIQNWIFYNILIKVEINEKAIAFRKKYSILDGASFHVNKAVVINIDLYRFFDTITERRVYGLFKSLGYHENLAVDFAKLCTVNPHKKYWEDVKEENIFSKKHMESKFAILPQGAPTSPIISNLILRKLDKRINTACKKINNTYSRYADDLSISASNLNKLCSYNTLKTIIVEEGFYI